MNNRFSKYSRLFYMMVLLGGISACHKSDTDVLPAGEEESVPLQISLKASETDPGLQIKLYTFSNNGNGYVLSDSLGNVISGTSQLKMSLSQFNNTDYRFLFLATSTKDKKVCLLQKNGLSPAYGTAWENIILAAESQPLSIDNYYGIKEMTGKEILQAGTIKGELTRLVGQTVLCIFKTADGKVENPITIDFQKAVSVMDRVAGVNIRYKNVTKSIAFEGIRPIPYQIETTDFTQNLKLELTDTLTVKLPQEKAGFFISDSIPGGAIIKGACLLPSDATVRIELTFDYYDTTPICMDRVHSHNIDCFDLRQLSLYIPKESEIGGISILPDHFTVTNAGIRYNRIVDLSSGVGLNVNYEWN